MKKFLPIIFILFFSNYLFAQNEEWGEERIKSMKIAFITKRLNLTVEEAQQFWPLYNEFDRKRDEIAKEKQAILQDLRLHFSDYSDKKIEEKIDRRVMLNRAEADLDIEYLQKFKQVLPIKKVVKLYAAENQFKRELIRRLQQRRRNGSNF